MTDPLNLVSQEVFDMMDLPALKVLGVACGLAADYYAHRLEKGCRPAPAVAAAHVQAYVRLEAQIAKSIARFTKKERSSEGISIDDFGSGPGR